MSDCPFCPPRLDGSLVRDEHERCLFLQPPSEILIGSGIIIPQAHRATLFDLTAQEWAATHVLLGRVRERLDAELAPQGYNVGWNCGSVAGQEVFHVHLHVIPRFADEPLAGRGIRHWLKHERNRRPSRR